MGTSVNVTNPGRRLAQRSDVVWVAHQLEDDEKMQNAEVINEYMDLAEWQISFGIKY